MRHAATGEAADVLRIEQPQEPVVMVGGRREALRLLLLIAPGQLISWGTLYYAIAFLAEPIRHDTGWSPQWIFLAFSAGLAVAGFAAAPVGEMLSRLGGRTVLATGSVIASVALTVIGSSHDLYTFTTGWLLAGLAMAMTQYEAAFSTLRQLSPRHFRFTAGWLTVVGGMASTVSWPLTHYLADTVGWRVTLFGFAALHLFPALALHLRLPAWDGHGKPGVARSSTTVRKQVRGLEPVAVLLAAAFAATAIVTATVSAHIGLLMEALHVTGASTLAILALIGPMQIVGRLLDLSLAARVSSSAMGLSAILALIAGVLLLQHADRSWALVGFAVAYGMANGMLTVVRAGVPTELLPHFDYATSLGRIAAPALVARAAAPALGVWFIGVSGAQAVPEALAWIAILGILAFGAALGVARFQRMTARG